MHFSIQEYKGLKVIFSFPTLGNQYYQKELHKLDTILKEYKVYCYAISNEPVFTQKRVTKPCKLEHIQFLSDFKKREFARHSGTYIYELSQLVKSCFIIDNHGHILYVKYHDNLQENFDINSIVKVLEEKLSV